MSNTPHLYAGRHSNAISALFRSEGPRNEAGTGASTLGAVARANGQVSKGISPEIDVSVRE